MMLDNRDASIRRKRRQRAHSTTNVIAIDIRHWSRYAIAKSLSWGGVDQVSARDYFYASTETFVDANFLRKCKSSPPTFALKPKPIARTIKNYRADDRCRLPSSFPSQSKSILESAFETRAWSRNKHLIIVSADDVSPCSHLHVHQIKLSCWSWRLDPRSQLAIWILEILIVFREHRLIVRITIANAIISISAAEMKRL